MANLTVTKYGNNTINEELFCRLRLKIEERTFLAILNILISIIAFCGNVLIIASLRKVSSLHSPSKLLLGCLATTDLCVGLITQPLYVTYILLPERSKLCLYLQIIYYTTNSLFSGVSLLTLTAISVDRLLALTLGLRYRQVVTLRRAQIFVITLWVSNVAFAMIFSKYFSIIIYVISIVVSLCIVTSTFCYTKIYYELRHRQAQVHVHQGPNGGGIPLNIASYRKTVSSALWVQMTFLACFLPYMMVIIIAITGFRTPGFSFIWDLAISLVLLNSSLNPFIYCWKIRDVRQAVKETIRQCCCFLTNL